MPDRQKIRLVVFDMAGTTVHDEHTVNRCLREALSARGLEVTLGQVNEVMGLNKPEAIRKLIASGPAETQGLADEIDAIHDDFEARMIAFYREDPSVRAIEGAEACFATLREAGVKVALDTGFHRGIAQPILDRLGWDASVVDATITSDEVDRGRPHPDMIRALMSGLEIDDVDAVAKIGDTPSDLHEGTNTGCAMVIGVTEGTHTEDELRPHPHTHMIGSVKDLAPLLGLG